MEISIDFLIQSIQPKDVIIFSNPALNSQEPHMYVCIGRFNDQIQFLISSTQENKIIKRVAVTGQHSETVVKISPSINCPFKKKSWFNCNEVKSYTPAQLKVLIGAGFKVTEKKLPDKDFESLVNGICISEIVSTEFIEYLYPK